MPVGLQFVMEHVSFVSRSIPGKEVHTAVIKTCIETPGRKSVVSVAAAVVSWFVRSVFFFASNSDNIHNNHNFRAYWLRDLLIVLKKKKRKEEERGNKIQQSVY